MNEKVRWGVLGVASIAIGKVIPAMQKGAWSKITAIASRDLAKSRGAAEVLGIQKAYGSYEELLADEEIEAIYNPLPNHLHVPWTINAAEAGKHVLCEKPIALNARDAELLQAVRKRTRVKIQEAFMVRTHPQWMGVRDLIKSGRIGELRLVASFFSYFNRDPNNVRNKVEMGGGALLDIGCYPITMSRFIFGGEPRRVLALIEHDPEFGIDRLTSAMLDFKSGQSTFTCSTQLAQCQSMQMFGTRGRIEVETPFTPPPTRRARIFIKDDSNNTDNSMEVLEFPLCNQYTIQGDRFSQAIRENAEQSIALEDSVKNMAVIDAVVRSAHSRQWEIP
jgi:predicted dehydrogenase